MAYLRRKLNDRSALQVLTADIKARQRRAVIATQMERQVDQALRETRDT
jgi:hypothetical protein